MLLIRGQHNLKPAHKGCVATIGNFDGVHRGHRAVLDALRERAQQYQLPTLLVTFEPQPLEYFRPSEAPARLTRLREKVELAKAAGVDWMLVLRFDQAFANQAPENFVRELLVERLGIRHLYIGDDFRFGRQRAGDFALLQRLGETHGFAVENLSTVGDDCGRFSSTRIREALAAGDLATAEQCLGHRYCISGRVAHGNKLGRTIGFPTLNVALNRLRSPLHGVFAVQVEGLADEPLDGVANIGNRPVLEDDDRWLLEVHLFDFDQQVYGRQVQVKFISQLRAEESFDSFEQMRVQIEKDSQQAREVCLAYRQTAHPVRVSG